MFQKLMVYIRSFPEKKRNACFLIIMYAYVQNLCFTAAEAQSKVVRASAQAPVGNSQVPSPDGLQTDNTVPNKYEDALGNLYRVQDAVPANQLNINSGVNQILSGYYSPKVFQGAPANIVLQAAEQGQGAVVQEAANNIMNGSMGAVNAEYQGLHQFWKDDIVGNLFQNIGQLVGKWLSEFIDGWLADTAQFLAKSLRTFVLNPNVAVNGLPGQPDDGHLSIYIREGADIMYGIAVDLLLLLF
ncbi:MAG: hypothetical protein K2X81_24705, partial [Candidatus Obscuribacterales bacterium]|nr:hypothetical protein [Candidatus Obscuribacterales bacterium]